VLDINGQPLTEGGLASLLCQIVEISGDGVRLRILNSDEELVVSARHDEVFGGLVADSELTAFIEAPAAAPSLPDWDGPLFPVSAFG
jgi:hypothetical protein